MIENDRVYVHFGQMGTACLSTEGKILWTAVLPHNLYYGPSSSPALFEDLLVVPCQGTDVRYVFAGEGVTGQVSWRPGNSNFEPVARFSNVTPAVSIRNQSGAEANKELSLGVTRYVNGHRIKWQSEVIRAAITLKLCNFEETGAIIHV